jgi:hypothetical protein
MYTLTLILSWQLAGPVAEVDSHPMFVDTLRGQIHLTGFTSWSACMNYKYTLPVLLNGASQPYSVKSKSCHTAAYLGQAEEPAVTAQ